MNGEMGKVWILHSILCDEIQNWEAFSATPPVSLGVGQNDQKMPKNVEEPPPSCQRTWFHKEYAVKKRDFFMLQKLTITDGFNIIGTKDQHIITKLDLRRRETWWCDDQHHIFTLSWGGLVAPIANHDLVLRRHFLHSTPHSHSTWHTSHCTWLGTLPSLIHPDRE